MAQPPTSAVESAAREAAPGELAEPLDVGAAADLPLDPRLYVEVSEPSASPYPFPSHLTLAHYGRPASALFNLGLALLRRARRDYRWVAFTKGADGTNVATRELGLMRSLEHLFADELDSEYSDAQRLLLV